MTTSESPTVKIKSNTEFVEEIMNFSPFGGLAQIFVVEALRQYAEKVASAPAPTDAGRSVINPVAWHALGTYVRDELYANYESR